MFKKIAIASAAAALFSIGQGASAGNTSNTMNVTANVAANCVVTSAAGLPFSGSYDPVVTNASASLDFTSAIAFKCTKNSSGVTVGIDHGGHYSSGRRLADTGAANFLTYDVTQPAAVGSGASCAYTQSYDTSSSGLFAVTGSNFTNSTTTVTVNICGRVPGGQDVPATGNYTDALTVQVNF